MDFLIKLLDAPNSGVKVLLLSRPEGEIADRLMSWPQIGLGDMETTQDDMRRFISRQVARLTTEVPHLSSKTADLKEHFRATAKGMFLYVRLTVDEVLENKGSSSEEISKILNRPPKDLDGVYEQYFLSLLPKHDIPNSIAVRTLQWILGSDGRMPLTVLETFLAVDPGDDDLNPTKRPTNIKALLLRCLSVLVCFRDNNVVLTHQLLADFLAHLPT